MDDLSTVYKDISEIAAKMNKINDDLIRDMVSSILEQTDMCLKYNIDEDKAKMIARYYIIGEMQQIKHILVFGDPYEDYSKPFMPEIISGIDKNVKWNTSFGVILNKKDP